MCAVNILLHHHEITCDDCNLHATGTHTASVVCLFDATSPYVTHDVRTLENERSPRRDAPLSPKLS